MGDKFCFAIDRGGTFTDVFCICPGGKIKVLKLLSEDPSNYGDAPREAIRRILSEETGKTYLSNDVLDTSDLGWIRMGTTVATNALLERKGERIALVISAGFKDLLHIGNQSRPKIFNLDIAFPENLYEEVVEVEERIILDQKHCEIRNSSPVLVGTTGENIKVWTALNEAKLRSDLQAILSKGIKSLAVVLMHSYMFPDHEIYIGKIATELGFNHVSLSSEVMPMVRIVPRGHTACIDAYLTPHIKRYVQNFSSGFKDNLKDSNVLFMQSDGGLTPMNMFCGSRAILSGPAGGVVGFSKTTYGKFSRLPVIGFDMGGTSTDVSRYDGQYEHVYDTTVAGVSVQAPQLDINTVAAGGGSMLFFRSGLLVVGPESAGAHPGPVCYRKGGPLTVTDANLCLGRLQPDFFPKIFGPTENLPLDKEATLQAFKKVTDEINVFNASQSCDFHVTELSIEEVALGFITVANEAMCRPIRALTQGKGFDTSNHILSCFGGAGSQHACAIAKNLGISDIFIHKYAGILSAYGMALADVVCEVQEACAEVYCAEKFEYFDSKIKELSQKSKEKLMSQGFSENEIILKVFLNMRYDKTDCALMCTPSEFTPGMPCEEANFKKSFLDRYTREFGFSIPDRPIVVDDIRIRGIGNRHFDFDSSDSGDSSVTENLPSHRTETQCYFEVGFQDTKIYILSDLKEGHEVMGPAIIIDVNCTIIVEPYCLASIVKGGNVLIKILKNEHKKVTSDLDMIQLSIFSHRFMSIAEQMGKILQRTSISTNIKERLDFSCALFGPDGGLVSNAPHIPVHLGAMQEAVQFQLKYLGDNIHDGDVILSNHPCAGGSHLPDLTVITPVFHEGQSKPVFFVACRGHHADIGGLTPGSMPPHSTSLLQEGATFVSFKLVKDGIFKDEEVTEMLNAPANLPGCSGTRNLKDNLSDLKAQVAANKKGIHLVHEIIKQYGLDVVQSYMAYIQQNAELAVRDMLKEIAKSYGTTILSASDYMDDGTEMKLKIEINEKEGSAIFNFDGTGYQVHGNCNTPRAVTLSAIIYCLRCMVGHDVPLNQGCLAPVKILIPEGSILSPSDTAAVVGGNVLTSQRIVDVIFKAFRTCAASQGCMNNITFGDESVGYYETVAGGAGAGPTWHGRSGVHTHMTNTRITDPEILERRYPVILQKFHLRRGTGGKGQFNGGDGVYRKILFRKDMTLSVLTERRVFTPYGMNGGENGQKGLNLLVRNDGRTINLGSKNSVNVHAGDSFVLQTPGGGGYGKLPA